MQRTEWEKIEDKVLAPYAFKSKNTRGRVYPEEKHQYRSDFQRDRDRVIHSTAFRRLEYKTQVFVNHEGDHYRTRLTHTIEVAQISRTIARALRLNEDLTEAIALAHDLGHTPFGHSGEEVLNELMKDSGGFEHNLQSLRVVDLLERKYPAFNGLNLTYEIREGIVKHETVYDSPENDDKSFHPEEGALLECQIVNWADEIAYNCHDIDDGLASGLLSDEDVNDLDIWLTLSEDVKNEFPELSKGMRHRQVVRLLINREVTSLVNQSLKNIKNLGIKSVEDVRNCNKKILGHNEEFSEYNNQIKGFLYKRMYCHHHMVRMGDKAKRILKELFTTYFNDPRQLPPSATGRKEPLGIKKLIADYIAGMTDRFALIEHKKLFDPFERV
ncbi:MAG: deoxyguanosinetriphosphate triphosphohydrolase [candidate division Zixibacteria bacterium]|nr:deoxyguanosinetriphosphate triphosphohydrolase [candidate division Zixibacteria bacterium]